MKLSKSKNVLYYRNVDNKLSEYQLLTQFNPAFINKKIKMCEFQIESMYHSLIQGRSFKDISNVLECSEQSVRLWYETLLDKIVEVIE